MLYIYANTHFRNSFRNYSTVTSFVPLGTHHSGELLHQMKSAMNPTKVWHTWRSKLNNLRYLPKCATLNVCSDEAKTYLLNQQKNSFKSEGVFQTKQIYFITFYKAYKWINPSSEHHNTPNFSARWEETIIPSNNNKFILQNY